MSNTFIETASTAKQWLKMHGYPYTDQAPLQRSHQSFANNGLYGIEVPVVNSMEMLESAIKWLNYFDISCNRFNETKGSFLLSNSEISEMLALCHEMKVGMIFALSPRPEYDTKSSFYRSKFGLEQARCINNLDAISYSIDEAMRLAELGCRGLVVYDIGVLSILSEMRKMGNLPADMYFKASSHCMASNPMIVKIIHDLGADSVTTIHDASLVVLQEMRRICPSVILDVPIDVYSDKGGYLRFNEISEIVQCASPVMLKIGASAQKNPYDIVSDEVMKQRIHRVKIGVEHLDRAFGSKVPRLNFQDRSCCLPAIK